MNNYIQKNANQRALFNKTFQRKLHKIQFPTFPSPCFCFIFLYNSNSNTNTAHTPQTKSTYLAFQSKHKNTSAKLSIKRSTINLPSAAAEPTPLHGRSHTRKNHHKQTDHTANSDETNRAGPHSSAANQAPATEHRHQKRPSMPPLIADTMNHQQRHGLSLG